MTQGRNQAYEKIKSAPANSPLLLIPDWEINFRRCIDSCGEGLAAAIHKAQFVNEKPYDGPICFISRQIKYTEARYVASQMECVLLVWDLEKLHYYLDGSFFEVITSFNAMKTPNRHMPRWPIAIQEYRAYHPQADGLAERMFQKLEEMISRNCAYGLEIKDSGGFTHDWCTLIPELEVSYNSSIHSSTAKPPAKLEKRVEP
ncbi:hypothetical protein O181_067967 [Austropuccinia psidii MF-1]|uniref:Reverse transcriptase/retrotransposon-derived protein RNase H-like domain-containing protein n=1 Tax=Austropuccinia psidii MF-1 TaxID=1389203 RepID=A0A9Q3I5U1_9BASI|nr:hypothetical protein [Austropuccinia psidii MF-1]